MTPTRQPLLFDEPAEPSQFEKALEVVHDMLDHWQAVLPEDEWARLAESVVLLFRLTVVKEKST